MIEPETPCTRTVSPMLRDRASIRTRGYGTAAATAMAQPETADTERTISYVPAGIEPDNTHTQIRKAAKELGLKLPNSPDIGHYASPDISADHFNILRTETSVQVDALQGSLLVDKPENTANLHGWCQVLRFRQRVDGFDGVFDVWKGMQQRGVKLPVSGDEADLLWSAFIHAALVPEPSQAQVLLLRYLYNHALHLREHTGQHYAGLHQLIVGRLLRIAPGPRNPIQESRVLRWHAKLTGDGFCEATSICYLTIDTLLSVNPESAFNRFKTMYDNSGERNLYDRCMPLVLQHGGERKALSWHRLFLRHGDKPSGAYAADPSIQFLHSWVEGQHLRQSAGSNAANSPGARNALRANDAQARAPLLSRSSLNSLVGEVHGIKAKTISDNFCARMVATQAFSFDFTLRGLMFLGAEELGPLSMRELAIRAQTPDEFRERVLRVKQSGIKVLDSMYIRILQRLAHDGKTELFQALLDSDQHPESYDDRRVQENLLNEFLVAENWHQVHLTLIGLSLADFTMTSTAWNRLLQHYAKARQYNEAIQIVEHLHSTDIWIHLRSINFIRRYLLPIRKRGKRAHMARGTLPFGVDSLDLIVNIHLRAAERRAPIEPAVWRELMKRYGMTHRMDRLERLSIAVTQMYSVTSLELPDLAVKYSAKRTKQSALTAVFTANMVQAIVVWGWRSASVRDLLRPLTREERQELYATSYWKSMPLHCEPWARGFLLLTQLRQLGVIVSDTEVADSLRSRLWMLFGPAVSRLSINLEAIRRNRHSLKHYIEHANEVWGRPLFDIPASVLNEGDYAQLAVAVFGRIRVTNKNEGQYVDVAAWAMAKARNAHHDGPPVRRARHFNWKYSPYRFSDGLSPAERRIPLRRRRAARPKPLEASDNALSPPQHPQTAAQPSSSRPQPSRLYTPEPS